MYDYDDEEDLIEEDLILEYDACHNYTVTVRCDDTGVEVQAKVHVIEEDHVRIALLRETGKLIKEIGAI